MCFSATASFGVGAVLLTSGVATMKKVKEPNLIPFASISLIFAAHQITEGMLWLALTGTALSGWEYQLTYAYIIIAQILWPITLPIAMVLIEKEVVPALQRKIIIGDHEQIAVSSRMVLDDPRTVGSRQNLHAPVFHCSVDQGNPAGQDQMSVAMRGKETTTTGRDQ